MIRERASMLRYTYIVCVVMSSNLHERTKRKSNKT
jgi:hypothetical protein